MTTSPEVRYSENTRRSVSPKTKKGPLVRKHNKVHFIFGLAGLISFSDQRTLGLTYPYSISDQQSSLISGLFLVFGLADPLFFSDQRTLFSFRTSGPHFIFGLAGCPGQVTGRFTRRCDCIKNFMSVLNFKNNAQIFRTSAHPPTPPDFHFIQLNQFYRRLTLINDLMVNSY